MFRTSIPQPVRNITITFTKEQALSIISRRLFCTSACALGASSTLAPGFALPSSINAPPGTAYARHPDFSAFENNSSETFERTRWIDERLTLSGVARDTKEVSPVANPRDYITKTHTADHIAIIDGYSASSGFTQTMGQAAIAAVGYILGAVDAVCRGTVRNAFCSIRPPGHHAQNSGCSGYCCYANVVIAARYAREHFNLKKILIVDWDYHQGNGTHGHICGDDDILFFETLNPDMYTTSCTDYNPVDPEHIFDENARRMNIRMPSGSSNDDFVRVFEEKLLPAADRFKPELVLISCGFDCKKYDSHGSFQVTAQGISRLTRILRSIADTHANGKLVSMLEGGYVDSVRDDTVPGTNSTFSGLSQCAENHVKTLLSGDVQPETPFYSGSRVFSMRQPKKTTTLRLAGGILSGLPSHESPCSVQITNAIGQLVASAQNITAAFYDTAVHKLPAGWYAVTAYGTTGTHLGTVRLVR